MPEVNGDESREGIKPGFREVLKPGFYFATLRDVDQRQLVQVGFGGRESEYFPRVYLCGFAESFPIEAFIDWRGPIEEKAWPKANPFHRSTLHKKKRKTGS